MCDVIHVVMTCDPHSDRLACRGKELGDAISMMLVCQHECHIKANL